MKQKLQNIFNRNLSVAQTLTISSLFALFLCTSVFAFTITPVKSTSSPTLSVQQASKGALSQSTSDLPNFSSYNFGYVFQNGVHQAYLGNIWTGGKNKGHIDRLFYNFKNDGYGGLPLGSCLERPEFIDNPTERAICDNADNMDLMWASNSKEDPAKNLLIKNITLQNAFRTKNAVGGTSASGVDNDMTNGNQLPHTDTFQSYMGYVLGFDEHPEWLVMQDSIIKNADGGNMIMGDTKWAGVVYQNLETYCESGFVSDAQARVNNDFKNFIGSYGSTNAYPCGNQIGLHTWRPNAPVWLINVSSGISQIGINNPPPTTSDYTYSSVGPVIVIGKTQSVKSRVWDSANNRWTSTYIDHPKVKYYPYIEDALAAGYERPPYIELSCSGWKTPPAGCTPETKKGYLGYDVPLVNPDSGYTLNITSTNGNVKKIVDGNVTAATSFSSGTAVILTATPASGYTFSGWSGACTGTNITCSVTMDDNKSVTANFSGGTPPPLITVNSRIQTTNNVDVNVRSTPEYIPTNILGTQPHGSTGTVVGGPITANNIVWWNINYDTGVAGWSGADNLILSNTSGPTKTYTLATTSTNGTIVASPAKASYTSGEVVTLTTVANTGYTFTGWSGDCSGTGSCVVTMTGTNLTKSVTASFTAVTPQTYAVSYNGNGNTAGTVPASQTKIHNVNLTLQANSGILSKTGYTFAGWNTNASGTGTSYAPGSTYSANTGTILYAQWTIIPVQTYTLTVTKSGTGAGTITKSPNKATYTSGEVVTLTASPAAGSVFKGWSGDCSGTGSCTVSMTGITTTKNVRAVFDLASSTPTNPPATQNKILSITGPATVEIGKTYDVVVKYDAIKDMYVTFNFKVPAASKALVTIKKLVPLGKDKTHTFTFTVPSGIPTDGTKLEHIAYIGTDGTWANSVHYLQQSDVTATGNVVPTYTLNTSASNGSITRSPNKTNYTDGENVTLTANPATGYQFSSWTGCTSSTDTCTVSMTSNKTVSASFTAIPTNPPAARDNINFISAPARITVGQTYTATVKYDAKESRYLSLDLKIPGSGTAFVNVTQLVPQGIDKTHTFTFTVPSGIPTDGTKLEYFVILSTDGSTPETRWTSRLRTGLQGGVLASGAVSFTTPSAYLSGTSSTFPTDLEVGMTSESVITLQQLLNQNGYTVNAIEGEAGSPGYESKYFGPLTLQALMRYQKDNGIPATGYFGPNTQKILK